MKPEDRKELEESRRDEMKNDTHKDLDRYYGLVKNRELDGFKAAMKKADALMPEIGRCPFELIKESNKAFFRLLQDLSVFSRTIDDISSKAERYLVSETKSEK